MVKTMLAILVFFKKNNSMFLKKLKFILNGLFDV